MYSPIWSPVDDRAKVRKGAGCLGCGCSGCGAAEVPGSYFSQNQLQQSRGMNVDMFYPGLNRMIPQDNYNPFVAPGRRFLSTDGCSGCNGLGIAPVRPDIGGFGTAVVLAGGLILVMAAISFMLGGEPERRAF